MLKADYLAKARENADVLRSLIGNYHPSAGGYGRHEMEITAPGPEAACEIVRGQIASTEPDEPVRRFDQALLSGDTGEIDSVLNGAWFGVPESTDCWCITGFREAVALMEDPAEQEE